MFFKKNRPILKASTLRKVFENGKRKAEEYARDPGKTQKLLEDAVNRAESKKENKGPLAKVLNYSTALFRLLQAYVRRDYTEISWGSIISVITATAYFVSPIDLIPDFIPISGFIDDATVIAFVAAQIKADLDNFLAWEKKQKAGSAV